MWVVCNSVESLSYLANISGGINRPSEAEGPKSALKVYGYCKTGWRVLSSHFLNFNSLILHNKGYT